MQNIDILIVDDDIFTGKMLEGYLSKHNLKTYWASGGIEALEVLGRSVVELIILDVEMPEMDGYEVCKKIKSMASHQHVPVIFLSGRNEEQDQLKGINHGAIDYLTKPFQNQVLLSKIQRLLEHNFQIRKKTLDESKLYFEGLKKRFLNLIGHEMRTPLNGIYGALQLIKTREEQHCTSSHVELLESSVERLQDFTFKILHYTSLIAESHYSMHDKISISKTIKESIHKYSNLVKEKKLKISLNSKDFLELTGNQELTTLLFDSIIENAIKYSNENQTIAVNTYKENGFIYAAIIDQGPGFSEDALNHLFTPLSNINNHFNKSEGLGLALAQQVALKHGGKIRIENLPVGAKVIASFRT
jgi:two-component system sensor histidine kinase/response regulator